MSSLPVILHVPHSGRLIPEAYRKDFLLDDAALSAEIACMTDHGTDVLFMAPNAPFQSLIVPWSRLLVDVERFADDEQEVMSRQGMGVLYEKTSDGRSLRNQLSPARRAELLAATYESHHQKLTTLVDETLARHGHCLIIDCHSFPREALPYEDASQHRPQICLGTDPFHTCPELVDHFRQAYEAAGFDVGINTPFAGSLVPLKHYHQDERVQSIMIEVRRDLYIEQISSNEVIYDSVAVHRLQQLASSAIHDAIAVLERSIVRHRPL